METFIITGMPEVFLHQNLLSMKYELLNFLTFMNLQNQKRAVIVGATSGIGYETACLLLKEGWILGIAGRREGLLKAFQRKAPARIITV